MNLLEFEQQFSSEEDCLNYLALLRWPEGFQCPRCRHSKYWFTSRKLYHCAACGYETSITAGTIFQDTRKPLKLWFHAVWYVVSQKNGVSAKGLQRVLGFKRYETIWLWLHKLRVAMVRPGRDRLSGIVEIDETYIGGERAGKRGRGAAGKSLVFIAVEDQGSKIGRMRLKRVPDASANSLMAAVKESVEPGSLVRTDGWSGYAPMSNEGFCHTVARKSDDVGENLLPMVNMGASLLKRWLLGTHQGAVRQSHLDYYLDEYTFRFNRRKSNSRGKLFFRLLQQAVSIDPLKDSEIRGGRVFS